jgi:hypothetical protein
MSDIPDNPYTQISVTVSGKASSEGHGFRYAYSFATGADITLLEGNLRDYVIETIAARFKEELSKAINGEEPRED